mgnify:FL=1
MSVTNLCLEITNKCYQNCIHCSSMSSAESNDFLSLTDIDNILNQLIPLGLQNISISGGEPFLHKDFIQILNLIHDKKITYQIYTCGYGYDFDINKLVELGCAKVIFSLHDFKSQYVISRTSRFDEVFDKIQKFSEKIPVEIHTVPMTKNFSELDELVSYLSQYKISFLKLIPQGRATKDLLLTKEQEDVLYNKLAGKNIRFGAPWQKGEKCTVAQNKLLITSDGFVLPCEAFKHMKNKCESIYDKKIIDVLNNDLFSFLRKINKGNVCLGRKMLND